jgi:hypothetical protein
MMTQWQDGFRAGGANARLGRRFNVQGRFMPEHGNTVVAQVTAGSATEAALIDLRQSLMDLPFGDHFAFTDVASYHMTVFEGVIETRREYGYWPADLALDTTIDEMTDAMADKLDSFAPPPAFRMKLAEVTPHGLTLTGATPQDEATVRAWRDGLSVALGFRSPDHDAYRFHTTMAYHKHWPPVEALGHYGRALAGLTADFAARVPLIELDPPAFCRFADMNGFPAVRRL